MRRSTAPDLADRLQVRIDHAGAPGNVLPALARLLRRLRDRLRRERASPAGADRGEPGEEPAGPPPKRRRPRRRRKRRA
jgi:hypothetical protein